MTVAADPLEELLGSPPDDGDYLHWAVEPYEVALCGAEIERGATESEIVGKVECPRCLRLGALFVDHDIWEGPGPRPPG